MQIKSALSVQVVLLSVVPGSARVIGDGSSGPKTRIGYRLMAPASIPTPLTNLVPIAPTRAVSRDRPLISRSW